MKKTNLKLEYDLVWALNLAAKRENLTTQELIRKLLSNFEKSPQNGLNKQKGGNSKGE